MKLGLKSVNPKQSATFIYLVFFAGLFLLKTIRLVHKQEQKPEGHCWLYLFLMMPQICSICNTVTAIFAVYTCVELESKVKCKLV